LTPPLHSFKIFFLFQKGEPMKKMLLLMSVFTLLTSSAVRAEDLAPVGVPECDAILNLYTKCLGGQMPAESQAQFKASMEEMRKEWREMAKTPDGKTSLVQACHIVMESTKQSLQAYNCLPQ
jgi:hypothetical protein